jgi:hypothetical protein
MTEIYIRVLHQNTATEIKGGQLTEHRTIVALIAVQPGFESELSEAAPVTLGDQILFSGRWYSVIDIEPDSYGATYKCTCSECKRLSEGVGQL